jgi:PAS domain S-box-containing protein
MATSPKRLALASQNKQKTTASDLKLVLFPNLPSSPAEYSVRALEERFSKAFHANPQPMSISTLDEGMYIDVNESFLNILGYQREDVIGHTSLELGIWTSPQDRTRFVASLNKDGRVRDVETTIHGNSGDVRIWLSAAELIELNGHDCILIASTDITERKQADEKLRDLSGRLIRAQEEERSRIARELHDDLNQQLAVLAVEIDHLKQNPPRHLKTFRSKVSALGKRTQEISAVVHHLSYQLHPSRLDYLGLVAALRALCMDVSESSGIRIEFTEFKVPQGLPPELSLCFYRVAQEALRNVVRHSGATSACCELSHRNGSLSLRIMDSGSGFDVDKAQSNRGLGLISMEERLRLVDGELRINSQPLRGTLIEARAPLSSDSLLRKSKP